jgi:hypothetical protein
MADFVESERRGGDVLSEGIPKVYINTC